MADKKEYLTGIDKRLFEDLYRYLSERPWIEVNSIIGGLLNAPRVEIKKQEAEKSE